MAMKPVTKANTPAIANLKIKNIFKVVSSLEETSKIKKVMPQSSKYNAVRCQQSLSQRIQDVVLFMKTLSLPVFTSF